MSPGLRLGALGFGLIAVCYGFARFAFGLFLPRIAADLPLSPTLGGWISAGSFSGYCAAIVLSAYLTERMGARAVAASAALVAALGMAGIAAAPSPLWLACAVMLAGSSTGLASPPMAAAVDAVLRPDRRDAANTIVNAGTSAGVVCSAPVALMAGAQWRLAFVVFAVAALAMAVAAISVMPKTTAASRPGTGLSPLEGALGRLVYAAFLMGAASTALWSFGARLAALRFGWGDAGAGMLWAAIGAAGIAGAGAGTLVARLGIDRVHRAFLAAMAAGIAAAGAAGTPALALCGGVLFGAAYVVLTGVYLIWGTSALPGRPATGLMAGFLAIAIGQAAGAPVFGFLLDRLAAGPAVATFAGLALAAGLARAGSAKPRPA